MQSSITAAILQGTRVSSGDASKSGSGSRRGETGTGTGMEWEWEWEREREGNGNGNRNGNGRQRLTASDGCVGQREGQHQTDVSDKNGQGQTDVSDRETDSIRRICRTERQTALDGRVGQEWTMTDRCVEHRDG